MISKSVFLWTAAAILTASACTGTLVLPGGSGGTSSSTGTAGYGTAGNSTISYSESSTTWDTSTYTGYSSSSGTTTYDCQPWVDFPGFASQTVRFVNQTGQAIYLQTLCDGRVDFSLNNPNGPATSYIYDTSCLQTCQALQTEPPYACGVCEASALRLDPGQTRDVVWDGTYLEGTLMEPYCFAVPSNGTCYMKRPGPQGSYLANATAWTSCTGSCSCDAGGACLGTPGGQDLLAQAYFSFPGAGLVELVFTAIPDGG